MRCCPSTLAPLLLPLSLAMAAAVHAQSVISLDGSLNGRMDVLTDLQAGPDYVVMEGDGRPFGPNLFHSFLQFDIGGNDSVTFTQELGSSFSNVIARVTGGDASNIDGVINSQIPGADFYLLNPAGILFGPAAQVNVPASLFLSTATDLVYENNGGVLDLVNPDNPVLSVEAPEAFGFDGGGPVREIVVASGGGLPFLGQPGTDPRVPSLAPGSSLTIAAGRFEATGDGTIRADEGLVQIAAVGTATMEVPVADIGAGSPFDAPAPLGDVVISNGTLVSVTQTPDVTSPLGTIRIRGGRFELSNGAQLQASGDPAAGATALDVQVSGEVDIAGGVVNVVSVTSTGEVRVAGDVVRIRDGGFIQSAVIGEGDGGALRIDGRIVEITNGGALVTVTQADPGVGGEGRGGDLVIDAEQVVVSTGGFVQSFSLADGRGGDVIVDASSIEVSEGGRLASETTAGGAGGDVLLTAPEIVVRDLGSQIAATNGIASASADPIPGGDIVIDTRGGSLRVLDGGVVVTQTTGPQPGGHITVLSGSVEISDGEPDINGDPSPSAIEASTTASGPGGSISLVVGDLLIARSEGSEIAGILQTAVGGGAIGPGGSIDVSADSVTLEGGGQISTTSAGLGASGSITLDVEEDVTIRGDNVVTGSPEPSGIFARADDMDPNLVSNADAGSVTIDARNVWVLDGGEISTRALEAGRSGSIAITATDTIRVAGEGTQESVVTARGVDGGGGDVMLDADVLEVLDGANVDVSSAGIGLGGLLTVTAGDVVVEGASSGGMAASIAAQADGPGDAQGIDITATRSVQIGAGGQVTALSRGLGGSPGDIRISAPTIAVGGGRVTAESGGGAGGSVALAAGGALSVVSGAEITARSADAGDAGDVSLSAATLLVRDSQITADADAFGGGIVLRGSKSIVLERANLVALSRGGSNAGGLAGGNITIQGGAVSSNATSLEANGFGNANGGQVLLSGDPVLISLDSVINVSSELLEDGLFVVDSPNSQVTGDLASLPETFIDASALLEEPCLVRDAPSGSFAVRTLGELPRSPDEALSSPPDEERKAAECRQP